MFIGGFINKTVYPGDLSGDVGGSSARPEEDLRLLQGWLAVKSRLGAQEDRGEGYGTNTGHIYA